jgi:y4mF family transcriptional regulator
MSNSISDFIRERRKQLKLTQPDLAARSGVGLRFVRELEQGKESVRLDKVNQVLALFGTEVGVVKKSEL